LSARHSREIVGIGETPVAPDSVISFIWSRVAGRIVLGLAVTLEQTGGKLVVFDNTETA